jgi:hypothetical protein
MKIIYKGPSSEVMLPKAGKVFKRGEAQDCPDALAEKLLSEQPAGWEAATKTITKPSKEKA